MMKEVATQTSHHPVYYGKQETSVTTTALGRFRSH